MRRDSAYLFSVAAFAAALILSGSARASITVEQIEDYETFGDPAVPTSNYVATDLGGSTIKTIPPGASGSDAKYIGITFHAVTPSYTFTTGTLNLTAGTYSSHADTVGSFAFGSSTVAAPYVKDVYADMVDPFLNTTLVTQSAPGTNAPVPNHFATGAKVVNNSYAGTTGNINVDTDITRRIDFMIHRDDVTFTAGAVTDASSAPGGLVWTSHNALAVRGSTVLQPFNPGAQTLPGKRHVDVWSNGFDNRSSYATGRVSGFSAALYGEAQAASQTNAMHSVVNRSLLMTGADKTATEGAITGWTRDLANNLDTDAGAGKADYTKSLSVLQAGEKTILPVVAGLVSGSPTSATSGWAYSASSPLLSAQQALLLHSDGNITGLTATLNWDVTYSQPDATHINTLTGEIFPDLALELLPVSQVAGQYLLGSSFNTVSFPGLKSDATGAGNDNVEHLYYTGSIPAGDYALVVRGDTGSLSAAYGLSYTLTAVPEPASVGILSMVGIGLLARRLRA